MAEDGADCQLYPDHSGCHPAAGYPFQDFFAGGLLTHLAGAASSGAWQIGMPLRRCFGARWAFLLRPP